MALSPELKRMVSGARDLHGAPFEANQAEMLASMAEAERELALLNESEDGYEAYQLTIRERLEWLGLQRATKQELREIIVKAMECDPHV